MENDKLEEESYEERLKRISEIYLASFREFEQIWQEAPKVISDALGIPITEKVVKRKYSFETRLNLERLSEDQALQAAKNIKDIIYPNEEFASFECDSPDGIFSVMWYSGGVCRSASRHTFATWLDSAYFHPEGRVDIAFRRGIKEISSLTKRRNLDEKASQIYQVINQELTKQMQIKLAEEVPQILKN